MVPNPSGHSNMMVPQMQTGSSMLHSSMMVQGQGQQSSQTASLMNPPSGPLQGYNVAMGNQMAPQHGMMGPQ